ncbi:hypothetical protein IGB19_14585, partial [Streptomyces sp. AC04842]|nr:hypothetical protein [Streptomyces sp. AC04842]
MSIASGVTAVRPPRMKVTSAPARGAPPPVRRPGGAAAALEQFEGRGVVQGQRQQVDVD